MSMSIGIHDLSIIITAQYQPDGRCSFARHVPQSPGFLRLRNGRPLMIPGHNSKNSEVDARPACSRRRGYRPMTGGDQRLYHSVVVPMVDVTTALHSCAL